MATYKLGERKQKACPVIVNQKQSLPFCSLICCPVSLGYWSELLSYTVYITAYSASPPRPLILTRPVVRGAAHKMQRLAIRPNQIIAMRKFMTIKFQILEEVCQLRIAYRTRYLRIPLDISGGPEQAV